MPQKFTNQYMIQTSANILAKYIMCEIRNLNRKNRVSTNSISFKHAIIADDLRTFFSSASYTGK